MKCPFCNTDNNFVIDKRESPDGTSNRRRRECNKCKKRFTTYETVADINVFVVKKDGGREVFDKEKMIKGLMKACEKRPISYEQITSLANRIAAKIKDKGSREINSREIGELVMKELKKLDKIAYIRFASVYREFTDLSSFESELKKLLKK
ncbi:MAG: transcriptional repressor NrdR [Nanoarchaeota archaeon]|nr:transcriptional repressor NrdR [Nanoarchaeota archaeon]